MRLFHCRRWYFEQYRQPWRRNPCTVLEGGMRLFRCRDWYFEQYQNRWRRKHPCQGVVSERAEQRRDANNLSVAVGTRGSTETVGWSAIFPELGR
jgi:hypothetical protein